MTKNGFQGLMKGVGQAGNGLAVAGGDQPAYTMQAQPQPVSAQPGGGLGGIIRRKFFGGPAQVPQPPQPGAPGIGTGMGSMVQRPGMPSSL